LREVVTGMECAVKYPVVIELTTVGSKTQVYVVSSMRTGKSAGPLLGVLL
jgi:hypothetical protein